MTTGAATTAADLFRTIGLRPDGPAILGRPMRTAGSGVYVVELPAPRATAPIELTRVGKWVERVAELRLDGRRPSSRSLAARLAAFWLPSQTVLYVGSTSQSIAGRVGALDRHVLGDRRPHAGGHWLKTLNVDGLRIWWAETEAVEEYEDALLAAFADAVPTADRAALHDASVVLPFANSRSPGGQVKGHGISQSILPEERVAPPPPGHVVNVAPGDADGARVEPKGTGSIRKGKVPTAPRKAPASRRAPGPRAADPVYLSADGLAKLKGEHADLVARRPGVVGRIRSAKELGDLKENSDYHAAREEQGFLEGRIQALEAQLRSAVVVAAPTDTTRVVMGSRVTVEVDGDQVHLTIVGTTESNPTAGRISHASPVGRALVGKSAGDEALIRTPGGEVRYRIIAID